MTYRTRSAIGLQWQCEKDYVLRILHYERNIYVLLYKVVNCKYAISHINKGFFATIQHFFYDI